MFKKLLLLCVIILPLMAMELSDPEANIEQIQEQTDLDQRTIKNAISEWKRHHREKNRLFLVDSEKIKSLAKIWQDYVATRQIHRADKERNYTINRPTTVRQREQAYAYWKRERKINKKLTKPVTDNDIKLYSRREHSRLIRKAKRDKPVQAEVSSPELIMPNIFIPQPDTPPTPIPSPRLSPFLLSHTSPYLEPINPSSSPPSLPPLELEPFGENW